MMRPEMDVPVRIDLADGISACVVICCVGLCDRWVDRNKLPGSGIVIAGQQIDEAGGVCVASGEAEGCNRA